MNDQGGPEKFLCRLRNHSPDMESHGKLPMATHGRPLPEYPVRRHGTAAPPPVTKSNSRRTGAHERSGRDTNEMPAFRQCPRTGHCPGPDASRSRRIVNDLCAHGMAVNLHSEWSVVEIITGEEV